MARATDRKGVFPAITRRDLSSVQVHGRPLGAITIANADAAASAYTDAAIDMAYRAVGEFPRA